MMWSVDTSIEPSLGKIRSLSADSCKHIRQILATHCTNLPNSGVYWVQDMQQFLYIYNVCKTHMHAFSVFYRSTVTWQLMVEDGHLYGNTRTWKHHLSPLSCTTSQITTRPALPMLVDGVIYLIRNVSIQQNKWLSLITREWLCSYAYKWVLTYNINHDCMDWWISRKLLISIPKLVV